MTAYLANVEPKQRAALERIQDAVLDVAPDAVEGTSYGMPAFILHGKAIASFAAFKGHLSFFPMSGTVLGGFESELATFKTSKGMVQFLAEKPLSSALVKKIVRARIAEVDAQAAGTMRRPHSRRPKAAKAG